MVSYGFCSSLYPLSPLCPQVKHRETGKPMATWIGAGGYLPWPHWPWSTAQSGHGPTGLSCVSLLQHHERCVHTTARAFPVQIAIKPVHGQTNSVTDHGQSITLYKLASKPRGIELGLRVAIQITIFFTIEPPFSYGFPISHVFHCFPMVFWQFSYGFPMVFPIFLRFSHGVHHFPSVFPWFSPFSYGVPMVFTIFLWVFWCQTSHRCPISSALLWSLGSQSSKAWGKGNPGKMGGVLEL